MQQAENGLKPELEHLVLAAAIAGVEVAEVVTPTRHHVVLDGMRLHYLDWAGGDSVPVVFLHGGGLNAHTWDVVCLGLRERHRCYALDLRGHGDSEWSPGLDYGLDAHLHDLEGFVEHLSLAHFALVGQSLGAIVGIRYAARHPSRLAAFIAVDAGPFVRGEAGIARIRDFVLGRDRFDSLEEAVACSVAFNPRRDPRLLRYSLRHALRPLPDGGWAWKRDRRHLSRDAVSALVQEVRALVPDAAAIGCPTLVVRAAESDVFGPDDAAEFAALVPDGRWVSVEDAGHNIQGDNPAGFLRVLDPFLAAHE